MNKNLLILLPLLLFSCCKENNCPETQCYLVNKSWSKCPSLREGSVAIQYYFRDWTEEEYMWVEFDTTLLNVNNKCDAAKIIVQTENAAQNSIESATSLFNKMVHEKWPSYVFCID